MKLARKVALVVLWLPPLVLAAFIAIFMVGYLIVGLFQSTTTPVACLLLGVIAWSVWQAFRPV
jgi:hypothetical protein